MIVIKEGKHENGLSIIGKIKDASKVATAVYTTVDTSRKHITNIILAYN